MSPFDPSLQPLDAFKPRELEVLRLIAAGMTNEEIAARLFIEVSTVRWHNRQIYSKLGVHHRTLAVAHARELGLLDDEEATRAAGEHRDAPASALDNLPAQTTSFIGREREIAKAQQLLAGSRLVTITGPGGIGKTRLALEVAAAMKDYYPDGIWFVSLAGVSDPQHVASAAAAVLHVMESATENIEASLVKYLRTRYLLLVIDNFEHVIAASPLLTTILAEAAHIKLLVTSREILRLYGEQEYPVPPLVVPDAQVSYNLEELAGLEAVRLFVDRARSVDPDFHLTDDVADAIARICARLDGLPLAIELAAARVKLFSPQQILARLESGPGVLGQGPRDAPARQRTLQATIDWSYNLLSEDEKLLFSRLGVFRGGWTLQAMEAVCGSGLQIDVLDGLALLIDKSLVQVDETADKDPRFRMLATVREYAIDCLQAFDAAETKQRHCDWVLQLAEQWVVEGETNPNYMNIEAEQDNFHAALEWCRQNQQAGIEKGLRLANGFGRWGATRGIYREGRAWLRWFLDRSKGAVTEERLYALTSAGDLAFRQGDYSEAAALWDEALEISEALHLPEATANLLSFAPANPQRGYDETLAMLERSLKIYDELKNIQGYAKTLGNLGDLQRQYGYYVEAKPLFERQLALARDVNNHYVMTYTLNNLGYVLCRLNDTAHAAACFRESLELAQIHKYRILQAFSTLGFAWIAAIDGKSERLACLLGAADRLFAEMGYVLEPADKSDYDWIVSLAHQQLADDEFQLAWSKGHQMTLEQAVTLALEASDDRD